MAIIPKKKKEKRKEKQKEKALARFSLFFVTDHFNLNKISNSGFIYI